MKYEQLHINQIKRNINLSQRRRKFFGFVIAFIAGSALTAVTHISVRLIIQHFGG